MISCASICTPRQTIYIKKPSTVLYSLIRLVTGRNISRNVTQTNKAVINWRCGSWSPRASQLSCGTIVLKRLTATNVYNQVKTCHFMPTFSIQNAHFFFKLCKRRGILLILCQSFGMSFVLECKLFNEIKLSARESWHLLKLTKQGLNTQRYHWQIY